MLGLLPKEEEFLGNSSSFLLRELLIQSEVESQFNDRLCGKLAIHAACAKL